MTDIFMPDRPVICPYDSNHSIAQSRFQRHVIKCSKNFPPNYRLCCPYNATHRFAKSLMENHLISCPDKQRVDREAYNEDQFGSAKSFEMEDRSIIHCDESWDDKEGTLFELSSIEDHDDLQEPLRIAYGTSFDTPPVRPQLVRPEPIRPVPRLPHGRAAVLMMEEFEDSTGEEDMESSASFACVGRGKPQAYKSNDTLLEKIRRGRGIATRKN